MLSETLANLTRRIAKELDHQSQGHLSEGDEGARSLAKKQSVCETLAQAAPKASPSATAHATTDRPQSSGQGSDPTPSTPQPASPPAVNASPTHKEEVSTAGPPAQRRPAKAKKGLETSDSSPSREPEETPATSAAIDWRKLHIN